MASRIINKILNSNKKATDKLVTRSRVFAALIKDKGTDVRYKSHEISDFSSKTDNFNCFVTSCKAKYYAPCGDVKSVSYVVKLNHCIENSDHEFFHSACFTKEGSFFSKMIPELNSTLKTLGLLHLKTPKCYFYDLGLKVQAIFLEDMRALGYSMSKSTEGLTPDQAILVLKELARMHASSQLLGYDIEKAKETPIQELNFLDDLYTGDKFKCAGMYKRLLETYTLSGANIAKYIEGYEEIAKAIKEMIPSSYGNLSSAIKSYNPKFGVVNHGDCWGNNLLFKYNEDGTVNDVCLIDYQMTRYASLALDLNYFLTLSVAGEVRRTNITSFLREYYDSFESVFNSAGRRMQFTYDELLKEYNEKFDYGCLSGLMILPILLSKIPVEDLEAEAGDGEFSEATVNVIKENPKLRTHFLDLLDEMVERKIIKIK